MTKHPRQVIREAVVATLVGKTVAQERVFATREAPWKRVELPGISVYVLEEDASEQAFPPSVTTRDATLIVRLVESLTENIDDALDALSLQVEQLLAVDPALGGTARVMRYSGMRAEITEEQGRPIGSMSMTYEVRYLP